MIGENSRKMIMEQCEKISIDHICSVKCRIAEEDDVLGFLDTSQERDGTRGIAFANEMMYVKFDYKTQLIPYNCIRSVQIISSFEDSFADELSIKCDGLTMRISNCSLDKSELKKLIETLCIEDSKPAAETPREKIAEKSKSADNAVIETARAEMRLAAEIKSKTFIDALKKVCEEIKRTKNLNVKSVSITKAEKGKEKYPKKIKAESVHAAKVGKSREKPYEKVKVEGVTEAQNAKKNSSEEVRTESAPVTEAQNAEKNSSEEVRAESAPVTEVRNAKKNPSEEVKTESAPVTEVKNAEKNLFEEVKLESAPVTETQNAEKNPSEKMKAESVHITEAQNVEKNSSEKVKAESIPVTEAQNAEKNPSEEKIKAESAPVTEAQNIEKNPSEKINAESVTVTEAQNVEKNPSEKMKVESVHITEAQNAEKNPSEETRAESVPVTEAQNAEEKTSEKVRAESVPVTEAQNVEKNPSDKIKAESVPVTEAQNAEKNPSKEVMTESAPVTETVKKKEKKIIEEPPKSAEDVIRQGISRLPDHKSQAKEYAAVIAEKLAEDALRSSDTDKPNDKPKVNIKNERVGVPENYDPIPIPEENINWLNNSGDTKKHISAVSEREEKNDKVYQMSGAGESPQSNESEDRERIQNMSREETLAYLAQSFNEINDIQSDDEIMPANDPFPDEEPRSEVVHINEFARSQAKYEVKNDTLTVEPLWGDIYIKASRSLREQCENGKLTMKRIEDELNDKLLTSAQAFMEVTKDEKRIPKVLIPKITELKEAVSNSDQYFKLGEDIATRAMFFMMYQMLSYADRITESPDTKARLNDFFRTFGSAGIALSMLDMRV